MQTLCSFTIPLDSLRALLPFAGTDITRPHLQGIRCEVAPQSDRKAFVTLIATDGRRLIVLDASDEVRSGEFDGRCDFTIPSRLIEIVERDHKKSDGSFIAGTHSIVKPFVLLTVTRSDAGSTTLSIRGDATLSCGLDEFGEYPRWRNVIPQSFVPAPSMLHTLSAALIGDFGDAFERLFNNAAACVYVPRPPAGVDGSPYVVLPAAGAISSGRCVGLLMPMRHCGTSDLILSDSLSMPMLANPDSRTHGHYVPPSAPLL